MDDDEIIVVATAIICITAVYLKHKQSIRRFWVNPYLRNRNYAGRYGDFSDMQRYPNTFRENFHMDDRNFEYIFNKIEKHLVPRRYVRRDIIPPRAKLAMILEYFACGSLQRHIASNYRVSKQAFGLIIDQVCTAICAEMSDEIPKFTKEQWIEVSNQFNAKWNFPNCVGAIDGKHIAIKCPPRAGSLFFNYKKFHSIVLMGIADANYRFIYVDVGAYGSEGDASVFCRSEFGQSVVQNTIQLPENAMVGSASLPFTFVADDAFPLGERIMKPYSPPRGRSLPDDEKIFNYRLSRARRVVENAFGILAAKFVCLSRTLFCSPERAQKIVAACCILHNYFLNNTRNSYCPGYLVDRYDANGLLIEGDWRKKVNSMHHLQNIPQNQMRPGELPKRNRELFKQFVNSPEGSLPWQRQAVFLE